MNTLIALWSFIEIKNIKVNYLSTIGIYGDIENLILLINQAM